MQAVKLEVPSVRMDPEVRDAGGGALSEVRSRVSSKEWAARVELAALYQLVAHFKWTDTIYNHISLRVPDEHSYLVNPFGYLYEEINASCLVKVSLEGRVIDDPTGLGINQPGFTIHSAIHAARSDVACILHTHTRAGCGVSAQKDGLLPISQHAAALYGQVAYHDCEGASVNLGERERLVRDLGAMRLYVLRNHGLLTAGRTAAEALYLMMTLERACEIQLAAQSGDADLTYLDEASLEVTRGVLDKLDLSRDWAAMIRLVDRVAPHYRT